MSKVDLRLDWCGYEAAKYAVEHWHYSKTMPSGLLIKIGAWEDGKYIGCVLFGRGGTYTIGKPYGLEQTEVCELVRVALTNHKSFTSRILSQSIKMLKKQNPGLRLIVSYADSKENHHGGIYQATNWIFTGGSEDSWIKVYGKLTHRRSLTSTYGTNSLEWLQKNVDPNAEKVNMSPKWKYLFPLDDAMRKQIEPLRKPYPKRERGETDNAPGSNRETGGASPTRSLTLSESQYAG